MSKILVFYWYVPPFYWHPVYDLHLRNLQTYKDVFDDIMFFISADEDSKGVAETIESIKYFIPNANIHSFTNDKTSRESAFFYDFVVKNIGKFYDNPAIFFAHNKGVQSVYVPWTDRNNWINTMYYFNLRNVEKIDDLLNDEKTCAIGCGRITNYAPHEFAHFLKYKWMFAGTFFWIVPNRIAKYVKDNDIKILENTGRYYTEGFLGTIFPQDAEEIKCTLPDKKLRENWRQYVQRVASQDEINDYITVNGELYE